MQSENNHIANQVSMNHDLDNEIRALDEAIARLQVDMRSKRRADAKRNSDRSFGDELIGVHCTPEGQNLADLGGTWDRMSEAWQLVGSFLHNAMTPRKNRIK